MSTSRAPINREKLGEEAAPRTTERADRQTRQQTKGQRDVCGTSGASLGLRAPVRNFALGKWFLV